MSCCCLCPLILSLKTWRRGANLHLIIMPITRCGMICVLASCIRHTSGPCLVMRRLQTMTICFFRPSK